MYCFFTFVVFAAPPAFAQDVKPALKIEARLFHSRTGFFSEDVLAPDAPGLGNVIIGENASSSAIVIVRINTTPALPTNTKLRLVAKETSTNKTTANARVKLRKLLDSTVTVPSTAADNTPVYIGFWLSDVGCMQVALKANLTTAGAVSATASATLDFLCYE